MITITKLTQTCSACPSQWDGWDAEGTYYYFRYRWGTLTVHKINDPNNRLADGGRDLIFEWSGDDQWDGVLSFDELSKHLEGIMDFNLLPTDATV